MEDSPNLKTQPLIQGFVVTSEPIYNELQKPFLTLNYSMANYLDEFCIPSGPPLVVCELENRGKGDLVQKTTLLSYPSIVSSNSLQRSQEVLQPYHDSFKLKL